jgi:hypothetical protein
MTFVEGMFLKMYEMAFQLTVNLEVLFRLFGTDAYVMGVGC